MLELRISSPNGHIAKLGLFRVAGSAVAIAAAAVLGGCQNDAQTGAGIGAAVGSIAGAVIGHQSGHGGEGAAIGAGIGAVSGYIIGNESDKAKVRRYDPNYDY